MGINKVIILGRLGNKPEVKLTSNNFPICNFSVATSEKRKEQGEWKTHTEWHKVVTLGKTAENCSKYLDKGSEVYVEGAIRTRKWEDKDGQTKYSTEIVGNIIQFLGKKSDSESDSGNAAPATQSQSTMAPDTSQMTFDDDDIPF